ncbi:MAG: cysteine synthase A [Desulfuromonas sp.]|nr:MAG: cysteine synthase A [Desulfuromonas sp.]
MPIRISNDTLAQIGNTPLVKLNGFNETSRASIWCKMESANPGGSVKDRIALAMITKAEEDGCIKQGDTIVEPTSGNTGIGLSLVAAIKGYKLILTMPETMSMERRRLLGAYGANLVLTPGSLGMRGAIEAAEEIAAKKRCLMPQQFKNPANPEIHRRTTGPEIIAALDATISAFVTGVGTGGTITGVGQVLKQHFPDALIVAVEPTDSPVLAGGDPGPHKIQGIGAGFIPEVLDTTVYQEILSVTNEQAMETARAAARKAGIFSGISSGANIFASLQIARRLGPGHNVVTTVCDTGERYLSTGVFD